MNIPGVSTMNIGAKNNTYGKQSLKQEDFMKLLLEELSHQDPLNPMDSKEFTVQLTQFSSLEGINDINKNLNNLLSYQQSMQNAAITGMIGKSVTLDGNSAYLNGSAAMDYDLSANASSVRIMLRNASGKVVRSEDLGAQAAGNNRYIWDGKDDSGRSLNDGAYTFDVEANDRAGDYIAAAPRSSGYVTGISFQNGQAYLVLDGDRNVSLNDIKTIAE